MLTFSVHDCLVLKQKLNALNPFLFFLLFLFSVDTLSAESLSKTISRIKPSIVAIGTFQKTRNPQYVFKGTGFVAGNGRQVITNSHLIPVKLDHENREVLAVFSGEGKRFKVLPADLLKRDRVHDLALLETQSKLPAMNLGNGSKLNDGSDIAITGFPLGMVLGLYPVTHQGIIAAHVPLVIPPAQQKNLTTDMIRALRNPFKVYQLDITAYPGNSGSPVYDPGSGDVIAVINSGYVKSKKETALSEPSGITYAIPVKFVKQLLAD